MACHAVFHHQDCVMGPNERLYRRLSLLLLACSLCLVFIKIYAHFMDVLFFIHLGPFSGSVVPLWTGLAEDNYICVW